MKTIKSVLLGILLLTVFFSGKAQDIQQEWKNTMNNILLNLDKNKITSGLLADYALELVDIASYDGLPSDTNYVDAEIWSMLYHSIHSAKINNKASLESPETVITRIRDYNPPVVKASRLWQCFMNTTRWTMTPLQKAGCAYPVAG